MVRDMFFRPEGFERQEKKMVNNLPEENQEYTRSGYDRRQNRPPAFSKYWLHGRRKTIRREEDRSRRIHLDVHSTKLFVAVILTMVFTIMDASFTLFLISRGATEVNPIMAFYLNLSPYVFFLVKYSLTASSIVILLILKKKYLFNTACKVRDLIFLAPIPFYLVVNWQVFLMVSR